jgi:uncharacterized protein (DUF58 family)
MPTRRGWAAFGSGLLMWLAARYTGSRDLHMIAAGVLALPFLAALFVQWNRVRLDVHRSLSAVRVFPGTRLTVTLTVQNQGPGAAPFLLMEDALPNDLGKPARLVVTGIPARDRQAVSYTFACRRRGRFTVGPTSIVITDPFGLARVKISTSTVNELIVYPEVEDVDLRGLAVQGAGSGESAVRHLYRSAAEFYTMREYVTGDDLRRIHWPSVARTGQLMIRQDETTRRSVATVFLDNRQAALGSSGSAGFERAVSVAATAARSLIRAGFAVRLATVASAAQLVDEQRLLEQLADVGHTRDRSMPDALRSLGAAVVNDSTLVMVTAPPVEAEVVGITRAGAGFGRKVIVLVHPTKAAVLSPEAATEAASRAGLARASLQRAGWQVFVIEPDGRLADAWRKSRPTKALAGVSSS